MIKEQKFKSLLEMSKSDGFTIEMLMHHLHQHYDIGGVRDFLLNRLYSYEDQVTMFYLPQICYLFISKPTDAITKYLRDKCSQNLCFYLHISWQVESYAWELMNKKKGKKYQIETFLNICDERMINMKDINLDNMEEMEVMRSKAARIEFQSESRNFINNLVKFSLTLKQNPEESERKPMAQNFQKNVNRCLWARRFKTSKNLSEQSGYLYEGMLFPFSADEKVGMSNLITNIIYRECTCFNTKKRVPYRMVVETIDPAELSTVAPNYEKDPEFQTYFYGIDPEAQVNFDDLLKEADKLVLNQSESFKEVKDKFDPDKLARLKEFAEQKRKEEEGEKDSNKKEAQQKNKSMGAKIKGLFTWKKKTKTDNAKEEEENTPVKDSKADKKGKKGKDKEKEIPKNESQKTPTKNNKLPGDKFMGQYGSERNTFTPIHKMKDLSAGLRPDKSKLMRRGTMVGGNTPLKGLKFGHKESATFQSEEVVYVTRMKVHHNGHKIHYRSKSCVLVDDLEAIERKLEFFNRDIFNKNFKNLPMQIRKKLRDYHEKLDKEKNEWLELEKKFQNVSKDLNDLEKERDNKPRGLGPWDCQWEYKEKAIRDNSPYSHFKSYKVRNIIIKGGDDLRQEIICMQLINKFNEIFKREGIDGLFVFPYEIIVTGPDSGVLEFVSDSISIDGLKKKYKGINMLTIFKMIFKFGFEEAQKHFTESLAAYSIIAYLLQIKDRHNGNQLINSRGHFIHIDFGFILCTSPGGMGFESAPFKLTKDYLDLMGGQSSLMFTYFRMLLYKGFTALRKWVDELVDILQIMMIDSEQPCFEKFDMNQWRERFKERFTDKERETYVELLIKDSLCAKRTIWYDDFQKMTNKIEP